MASIFAGEGEGAGSKGKHKKHEEGNGLYCISCIGYYVSNPLLMHTWYHTLAEWCILYASQWMRQFVYFAEKPDKPIEVVYVSGPFGNDSPNTARKKAQGLCQRIHS